MPTSPASGEEKVPLPVEFHITGKATAVRGLATFAFWLSADCCPTTLPYCIADCGRVPPAVASNSSAVVRYLLPPC